MAQHLCTVENCFIIPGQAFVPKPEVSLFVVFVNKSIKDYILFSLRNMGAAVLEHLRITKWNNGKFL